MDNQKILINTIAQDNAQNIFAQANAQAAAAMAEIERSNAEKKQMRKTIAIVCVGFIILAVAGIFIFRSRR